MTRVVLRFIAVAIAIAGLIDPAFTIAGHARARIAVVVQDGPTMELPAKGEPSRRVVAERVRDRLANDLGADYDIQPRLTSDAAAAIVIGDRYPESSLLTTIDADIAGKTPGVSGFSRTVATVTVSSDITPNVRIARLDAPRQVPARTAIRIGIDVEGAGVVGKSSTLVVRMAGVEIGRASHGWREDREQWHAAVDAVPVGDAPFIVRVEAQPLDAERITLDNAADAVVDIRRAPLRVEIYEPRPSWATTFVRRALEADTRFHVAALTLTGGPAGRSGAMAGSVATRTSDAVALADAALDGFDVVIAGGVDRLSEADVRALDRFMRERGGAVVVIPDARIDSGPARGLMRGLTLTERLSERPEKLAVVAPLANIQASELLLMRGDSLPAADRIVWAAGPEPASVVVSLPRGNGRLVFSGALDAWRFRAEDDRAFDRFWQSTVAGLALAAPPPIDISVVPPILKPGERGEVIVRVRGDRAVASGFLGRTLAVSAGIDGQPIRLLPEAEAGLFRGSFAARNTDGRSTIVAHVDGAAPLSASRPIIVSADARRPFPAAMPPLSMLASSRQGIDVTPDNLGRLESFIRRTVAPPAATVTRRPMRSGWWMVPFAVCLSTEWWLRRRRGER